MKTVTVVLTRQELALVIDSLDRVHVEAFELDDLAQPDLPNRLEALIEKLEDL